jgi:tetratricopeptide (TPR) repeat protein
MPRSFLILAALITTVYLGADNSARTEEEDGQPPYKFGYINKLGRFVIAPQFHSAGDFEDGVALCSVTHDDSGKPKHFIFIDKAGERLGGFISAGSTDISQSRLTPAAEPDKYGYFERWRRTHVLPNGYSWVEPFANGYAVVFGGEPLGNRIIDRNGNTVFSTAEASKLFRRSWDAGSSTTEESEHLSRDGFKVIDLMGETFCISRNTGLTRFHEGLACIKFASTYGYVDKSGNYAIPLQNCIGHDFSEGLAHVQMDRHVFLNRRGEKVFVLGPEVIDAGDFHEGRAPVLVRTNKVDKQGQPISTAGFVDQRGRMVIKPTLTTEYPHRLDGLQFSDGLCRVFNGTKYGYIDRNGHQQIPYTLNYCGMFHEGLAPASQYYDKTGKPVDDNPELAPKNKSDDKQQEDQLAEQKSRRGSLRLKVSGEPYFRPVSKRIELLEEIVSLDESLKDDNKSWARDQWELTNCYLEAGRWQDAEKSAIKYIDLDDDADIKPLIDSRKHQRRFAELEAFLKQRIELGDNHGGSHEPGQAHLLEEKLALGDVYYERGEFDKAQEQFADVFKATVHTFAPSPMASYVFEEGRWRLIYFHQLRRKYKDAISEFHELASNAKESGHLQQINTENLSAYLALLHQLDFEDFKKELSFLTDYVPKLPVAKWGFIDVRGQTIVPPQFTGAGFFKDGLANVATIGGWGYVDRSGIWKIQPQFYSAGEFSEGVAAVSQSLKSDLPKIPRLRVSEPLAATGLCNDCSFGYIDKTGEYKIRPYFIQARPFSQGLAAVEFPQSQILSSFGYVDHDGKIALPPIAKDASPIRDNVADLVIRHASGAITKGQTATAIDRDYSLRIPVTAFKAWLAFRDRYLNDDKLTVQPAHIATADFPNPIPNGSYFDALFGFVDLTGEVLIKPQFSFARPFSEGFAAVQVKGKWGYISPQNKVVISPIYDEAESFQNGVARVAKGNTWGLIDKTGKEVVPCQYKSISEFSEGHAVVCTLGTRAREPEFGFVDTHGKWLVEPKYANARNFKNGFAAVEKGAAWGFIDKEGVLCVPAEYADVKDFSDGLAAVRSLKDDEAIWLNDKRDQRRRK